MSSSREQVERIELTFSESCQKLINTKNNLKAILKGQKKVIDFFEHINESPHFSKNLDELDHLVYKFGDEDGRKFTYKTLKEVQNIQLLEDYSAYIYTIGVPHFCEIPYLVCCSEEREGSQDIKMPLNVPIDMMPDFPFGECVIIYGRLKHTRGMEVMLFREIPKAYVKKYFDIVTERNAVMRYL